MANTLPPDPENQNDQRARWAMAALRAYRDETGVDQEDALANLLCDLRHTADREELDFEAELERSRFHYELETAPDPKDLLSAAQLVIERWSCGDLAEAIRQLEAAVSSSRVRAS